MIVICIKLRIKGKIVELKNLNGVITTVNNTFIITFNINFYIEDLSLIYLQSLYDLRIPRQNFSNHKLIDAINYSIYYQATK